MLFSSFSKDISPGLRVGWVAPGRYQAEVEWLKFSISGGSADPGAEGDCPVSGERRLRTAPAAHTA